MLRFSPLPPIEDGQHMSWEEFEQDVKHGGLIDYDGFAELATATQTSNKIIKPSDVEGLQRPEWATHVVWYNR